MPPLIAFAGALGGLAVVRWAYKTAVRINRELEEARLARVAEAARRVRFRRCAATPSPALIGRARDRQAGFRTRQIRADADDLTGIALIPCLRADTVPRS